MDLHEGYLDDTALVAVDSHLGAWQELVLLLPCQLSPKHLCQPLYQLCKHKAHQKQYSVKN